MTAVLTRQTSSTTHGPSDLLDDSAVLALDTVESNAVLAPTPLALPATAEVLAGIRALV